MRGFYDICMSTDDMIELELSGTKSVYRKGKGKKSFVVSMNNFVILLEIFMILVIFKIKGYLYLQLTLVLLTLH